MNVQYPLRTVHNYAPTLMEVMYAPVVKVTLLEVIGKPAMIPMNVPLIMETVLKHVSIPLEASCAHAVWAMDLIIQITKAAMI